MPEYFYRDSRQEIGPVSWATIVNLCERDVIGPTTEIKEDARRWRRAENFGRLRRFFLDEELLIVPDQDPESSLGEISGSLAFLEQADLHREAELDLSNLHSQPDNSWSAPSATKKGIDWNEYLSSIVIYGFGILANILIFMNYPMISAFLKDLISKLGY